MADFIKTIIRAPSTVALFLWADFIRADYRVNFPEPATPNAREIYDLHMLTSTIGLIVLVVVFLFVFYALYFHRKSRGAIPNQTMHQSFFGHWAWLVVPAVVLGVDLTIAGNAQQVLEKLWLIPKDENMMDIKIIGHQWWWEYKYLDHDVAVESRFVPEDQAGDHYLREVDNPMVLPTHTKIRFLHTSSDVMHAFWVPELGMKKDAISGYITETWTEVDREGTFRGQCAELCGTWHSRMPIVVQAVSPEKFGVWVEKQRAVMTAAAQEAASDKTWRMEELAEKGRALYDTNCSACHQLGGIGLPPAFPPLKGSPIVTGPLSEHLKVVLNGRPGTAMQSWARLNNLEIAAIVTYERNSWGNDTGDIVQPVDVAAAR